MPFVEAKFGERRRLGDKDVFPIGFGAMGLSTAYGKVGSDEERLKVSFFISLPFADALLPELYALSRSSSMHCMQVA